MVGGGRGMDVVSEVVYGLVMSEKGLSNLEVV